MRKSNTDHHIDYVINLAALLTNDPFKREARINKMTYCFGKLLYNVKAGKTDKAYIRGKLEPMMRGLTKDVREIVKKSFDTAMNISDFKSKKLAGII